MFLLSIYHMILAIVCLVKPYDHDSGVKLIDDTRALEIWLRTTKRLYVFKHMNPG